MSTIIVAGFGPVISKAVADKFGAQGFSVALVARNQSRLQEGVTALRAKGIKAGAFPADLSDPAAIKPLVAEVKSELGPIKAFAWNAYTGSAGNVLDADAKALREVMDLSIVSLTMLVQETLGDLKEQKGAVLVTNGAVVTKEHGSITEEIVERVFREQRSSYMRPKNILLRSELLPRTPTGKVSKRELRPWAEAQTKKNG